MEFVPHPPRAVPAGARVLAVADGVNGGSLSVVAMSIGAREGVENGQVYSIWGEGPPVPDRVQHSPYSGAVWGGTKVPRSEARGVGTEGFSSYRYRVWPYLDK